MRKASSTKGARLGIVPLSILKRSTSRHPAFWDAGEQGDNMSILLDHAEMILSRAVGVNAAFAVASIDVARDARRDDRVRRDSGAAGAGAVFGDLSLLRDAGAVLCAARLRL